MERLFAAVGIDDCDIEGDVCGPAAHMTAGSGS